MTYGAKAAAKISAAIFGAGLLAPAVHADTQTGTAEAQVIETLALTKTSDFVFGKMINTNPVATQVELNWVDGNRYCQPGIICSGTHSFAEFDVVGSDVAYQISFPATMNLTGPGITMVFAPQTQLNRNISGGSDHFRIGGWLTIPANQIEGNYNGSLTVTAEYN